MDPFLSFPPYRLARGVETRWANAENPDGARGAGGQADGGRKGSPFHRLRAGESWVMARASGAGTIRRIWVTLDERTPEMLQGVTLAMYWDGARDPAVEAPLCDLFGSPFGRLVPFENAYFSSPDGNAWNCLLPMPFRQGMRIVATNRTKRDVGMFFYQVDYTLGDPHDDDTGYLHAVRREESPTVPLRDYCILPRVLGRGRYLGCSLGIDVNVEDYGRCWWGEGEVKVYLDGDGPWPTLCGTGTEDYVGAAWGVVGFCHRFQGCPLFDDRENLYGLYRFHGPDPVWFGREIRVTIQQIGQCPPDRMIRHLRELGRDSLPTPGYGVEQIRLDDLLAREPVTYNIERFDRLVSTAYLYLDRPSGTLDGGGEEAGG